MPTILLTGFEPFGDDVSNPSWAAVQRAQERWSGDGELHVRLLPVDFTRVDGLLRAALEELRPEVVIAVGLAGGSDAVRVERIAINVDDARIPDNSGFQPVDEPVVADAPAAYFSSLPVKAVTAAIRDSGVPAVVSQTAGTFVCNHVFYLLMHELRQLPLARGGFIHVPYSDAEASGADRAFLTVDQLATALTAAVRASIANETDLRLGAGALD